MTTDPMAVFLRTPANTDNIRRLTLYAAVAGFSAHLLITSRLTDLAPGLDVLRFAAIGVILLASFIGVGLCLAPKKIGAGIAAVACLIAVPLAVYNFNLRTNQPFNWSSGGLYYGIGLVGLFVVLSRQRGNVEKFLRIAFGICVGYSVIYLVLAPMLRAGYLVLPEDASLLLSEDETSGRPARMIMASSHVAFMLSVSFASVMQRFQKRHLLIIVMALGCLWLAQSRLIAVLTLAVLAVFMLARRIGAMGIGSFVLFVLALIAALVVTFSTINPFENITNDQSAWARARDIDFIHATIKDYWFTGAGVAAGDGAYVPFTKLNFFFPSDIGMIGHYFNFGVLGLMLYTAQAYGACTSSMSLGRIGVDTRFATGVALMGIISTLYSVLAPVFAGGSATVFGALFLALLPYSPIIGFWKPVQAPRRLTDGRVARSSR